MGAPPNRGAVLSALLMEEADPSGFAFRSEKLSPNKFSANKSIHLLKAHLHTITPQASPSSLGLWARLLTSGILATPSSQRSENQ